MYITTFPFYLPAGLFPDYAFPTCHLPVPAGLFPAHIPLYVFNLPQAFPHWDIPYSPPLHTWTALCLPAALNTTCRPYLQPYTLPAIPSVLGYGLLLPPLPLFDSIVRFHLTAVVNFQHNTCNLPCHSLPATFLTIPTGPPAYHPFAFDLDPCEPSSGQFVIPV